MAGQEPTILHIGTTTSGPRHMRCQNHPVRQAGVAVAFSLTRPLDCDWGLQLAACPSPRLECTLA